VGRLIDPAVKAAVPRAASAFEPLRAPLAAGRYLPPRLAASAASGIDVARGHGLTRRSARSRPGSRRLDGAVRAVVHLAQAVVRAVMSAGTGARRALFATAASLVVVPCFGQQAATNAPPAKGATQPAVGTQHSRYQPDRFAGRAGEYYRLIWGVDALGVKWTESGEVIRFSYRVLDAEKAKTLNDKGSEPSLIDSQAGVSLVVPSMEQIGQLRQSSTPEAGKSYWMAFSNKGRLVKRGHRVSVVIGKFRADGLVVD
jgi:hypothetical protein